jgi:general secretion pathway protein D
LPLSVWGRIAAIIAPALLAGGCTLPWQQLALPGPYPSSPSGPSAASANRDGTQPFSRVTVTEPGTGQFHGSAEPRAIVTQTNGNHAITINLAEATIAEAAKSILGDTLGVNYVVSDKLKGSITLQTSKPIPREALLDVFETLLRGEGASLVVQDGLYRIVPAADAVAQLRGKGVNYRRLPGMSSIVVPLQYVAAAEMDRIIRSVAPQSTVLRVDTARNLLVVSGSRSELDAIMDAVSIFDVDWMKGMSFGIYPIESGDVEAIAQELDAVFATDQDGPSKGLIRFVPNRRLKSILVITPRPQLLTKAESWLRRIELVGRNAERQVHVYRIQHRPAGELAVVLQKVYAAQEARPAATGAPRPSAPAAPSSSLMPDNFTGRGTLPAPEPSAASFGSAEGEAGTGAVVGELRGGNGAGSAGDERSGTISVVADDSNNALIITATPAEYRKIRGILERIDILPNQVLLEATIAEVRLNDDLKMGLRWFFRSGKASLTFTDSAFVDPDTGVTLPNVTPEFPGFSHFFNAPNVQVVLNALSRITDVNIVSSPTLTVLDNKKATLQVGDEVPIATASAVATITPNAPIVNAISFRSTGIVLNITPRISDNGRVLLEIEQEASDVVPTTTSTLDSPTIQQRRVKTTVSVKDGEGVLLGGLIQDRATNTRDQLPLLGDIPVVGNLFKHKDDRIARTELLIAITPRVIKDTSQLRAITEEFRDKINMSTRPQRQAPPDRREQIDRVLR